MRKYSRINKNRKKPNRKNLSYLKIHKTSKTRVKSYRDVTYTISLNKNGGIVDVSPRIGDLFTRLYGRQFESEAVEYLLREYAENKIQ